MRHFFFLAVTVNVAVAVNLGSVANAFDVTIVKKQKTVRNDEDDQDRSRHKTVIAYQDSESELIASSLLSRGKLPALTSKPDSSGFSVELIKR